MSSARTYGAWGVALAAGGRCEPWQPASRRRVTNNGMGTRKRWIMRGSDGAGTAASLSSRDRCMSSRPGFVIFLVIAPQTPTIAARREEERGELETPRHV